MNASQRNKPLSDQELLDLIEDDDFWAEIEDVQNDEILPECEKKIAFSQILDGADQSDEDEKDNEIFSDHNSESEIEPDLDENSGDGKRLEDITNSSSDSDTAPTCSNVCTAKRAFYGKDKTKWSKEAPCRTKTLSHNIISVSSGLKGPARQNPLATYLEAWNLLITDDMIKEIVVSTNIKIDEMKAKYTSFKTRKNSRTKYSPTFVNNTDESEVNAFIGLLYLQGLFKSGHEDLRSLWATDGTGRPLFRCTMSLARFSFLLTCFRFDDGQTRRARAKENKLAAISDLFEQFVKNCKENYSPGANVTIDEMLVPFRGRCSFRMYIPNKPAKYGLKVQILADSKTHYMLNAEVYTGKNIKPEKSKFSHPTEVVLRLIEPISNSNRNITADNWYSSIELIDELKKYKLTYVGTMKKNKRQIPPEFLPNRTRPIDSSLFGFSSKNTIVSHVPKRGKAVVLISSMHHDVSIEPTSKKPEIILYYNSTKAGVDALDEKCANYSTSRRTRRWPMTLFHAILNIAGVNSRVIYQFAHQGEKISRYNFLKGLGRELCTPYMTSRVYNSNVPRKLRSATAEVLGIVMEEPPIPQEKPGRSKRPRCRLCPPGKDRKTTNYCKRCKIPICLKCAATVCPKCI